MTIIVEPKDRNVLQSHPTNTERNGTSSPVVCQFDPIVLRKDPYINKSSHWVSVLQSQLAGWSDYDASRVGNQRGGSDSLEQDGGQSSKYPKKKDEKYAYTFDRTLKVS